MELPDVVSVRKFRDFNGRQKAELYETLLDLAQAVDEIPKKSLRKMLELSLAVLRYKGEQADTLQRRLEEDKTRRTPDTSEDSQVTERLLNENEKLKRMLEQLDSDKTELKAKIKALSDEILQLQRRLQEAAQAAEASDKDSTDPLSELDKQEELLHNIDTKNKHIKRLLREIEALQNQNIEQTKTIIETERALQHARTRQEQLMADLAVADGERKALKESANELSIEMTRLEGNITYLEEERDKSEMELKDFIEKLEVKAESWKKLLDAKDAELKRLRVRLEKSSVSGAAVGAGDDVTSPEASTTLGDEDDDDDEDEASAKLLRAIETRDKLIEQLELKIKTMAEEMLATTKVMDQLITETQDDRNPQKARACCKQTELARQAANARCTELGEMLERCETDNALKAKQTMQAIEALSAYESGEDGLVKALRRCGALEQKLTSRDKQIRALIMELNSLHEIAHENAVLRQRLNIPDDTVVTAKNLLAKERNKQKIIDRLTLKLRASEELRLQLKLEKCDLRRQLQGAAQQPVRQPRDDGDRAAGPPASGGDASAELLSLPSEVGEVQDSAPAPRRTTVLYESNICAQCKAQFNLQFPPDEESQPAAVELQTRCEEALQENETLRLGMHEILERLREYDASSDHITIDSEMLQRLLEALPPQRALASTPKRLQGELDTLKEREEALRELLQQTLSTEAGADDRDTETDELASIEAARDGNGEDAPDDTPLQMPPCLDTSTRPTTPNKSLPPHSIPVIAEDEVPAAEIVRALQQQLEALQVYRQQYELLAADAPLDVQRNTTLQLELARERSSYAYMRQDFDVCLSNAKQSELRHLARVAELQRALLEQQERHAAQQLEGERQQPAPCSRDEYEALLRQNAELQAQLAQLVGQGLAAMPPTAELCADYGVIEDNLQLDYVTAAEYAERRAEQRAAAAQQAQLSRKTVQLEGLLDIAREQLQSQQRLLNELTDNHIDLRHLVADLQSDADHKFLLAKMQRDLDAAKGQVEALSADHDALQQRWQRQQAELTAAEQRNGQLRQNYQTERHNRETKIKFLQKSLLALRFKYAKFTPLVFLTNFVYAYKKFAQRQSGDAGGRALVSAAMQEQLDTLVAAKLEGNGGTADEAQQLIKTIRAEMQIKLLEESGASLQAHCAELQRELTEQRLRAAQDSEHWQTIAALFGQGGGGSGDGEGAINDVAPKDVAAKDVAPKDVASKDVAAKDVASKDVATNTEDAVAAETEAVPVAAARRLPPASIEGGSSKPTVAQRADKNTSPIWSPVKALPAATQTDQATPTHSPKRQAEMPTVSKQSDEPLAQPATERTMVSQSVQTADVVVAPSPPVDTESAAGAVADMEQQLQLAQRKAAEREQLLHETQEYLSAARKRVEELQSTLANSSSSSAATQEATERQAGIIETTILSFHTLLTEKDKSITKYQDLLQSEREQQQSAAANRHAEVDNLRSTIANLNFNIRAKDMEILELKTQLEANGVRRNLADGGAAELDASGDNSLNELTDEKIEEMFQHDDATATAAVTASEGDAPTRAAVAAEEKQDTETLKEAPAKLLKEIKELKDKASYWQQSLRVKDEELTLLREKVNLYAERERTLAAASNPEVEQLRAQLDEKDKHISDLLHTLNSFHDDQQRYINETSNDTDRISKLAADLTRTEATNKIYHAQVEALRRQLASLTQREKQARELNQTLRNQLIKRPVVSIKTELNARVKSENLQKRNQQLELELEEARAQLQRQQIVIETKRARSANEVGLWEKQKRWQQSAEKFKAKLDETECLLEKTRTLLQTARNTVTRLEKDKQVLEVRLGRAVHGGGVSGAHHAIKCCRTPSCPNLQQSTVGGGGGNKYTPSDSPETYTGATSSECSSPAHSAAARLQAAHYYGAAATAATTHGCPHGELLEALKARLELQQRKIMALELEGHGSNALTNELEKQQERLAAMEAQNIRLEAKNLQLQLDNDMQRQGDGAERAQKRIKHLEDYIIALKEEMAQAEARRDLCKCAGIKLHTQQGQSAEHTILSLRNIVEKLRAENKYLREASGRRLCDTRSATEPTVAELSRLQQMYAESLEKIAALHSELKLREKCGTQCRSGGGDQANADELQCVKELLCKKTQLLQKAKVLLTRAAAKEKLLKEQLTLWKRKCSELQNVPVIDEISE